MADDERDTGIASPPVDPLVLLSAAKNSDEAREYLRKQNRLLDLQIADLEREDTVRHWSLRIHHVNDLLKLAFGIGAACVALMIAVALVAMVWNAREATGLVIQPIKAPPDFAVRGLDGTVLAQRLLDKLNGLVREADKWSFRSADSISGNWGNDSKVQIPETGVSLFELQGFLRASLGNQTSMSGELYRTPSGIALTVRVDANAPVTFEGREQDMDKLLSRAAESLLEQTQAYRYVLLLYAQGHPAASIVPVAQQLVEASSGVDQTWSRSALEEQLAFAGRFRDSVAASAQTIASAPGNPVGYFDMGPPQWAIGHLQQAIDNMRQSQRLFRAGGSDFRPQVVPFLLANADSFADDLAGAYGDAVNDDIAEAKSSEFDMNISAPAALANDYARNHDSMAARAILTQYHITNDSILLTPEYVTTTGPDLPNYFVLADEGDWIAAAADLEYADRAALARNDVNDVRHSLIWPQLAYAWAQTGRMRNAEGLIARTPMDCTLCLEMRGRIAAMKGDGTSAVYWFDRAIGNAPSLPFAETGWGAMLMAKGDLDGAIVKFTSAHKKSPHFADPLEVWGEALMAKSRSDLALAKFEEANKYAPNWGRLHLKWGEALYWSGDKDGAQKQFAVAATLDLTPSEKAERARVIHG